MDTKKTIIASNRLPVKLEIREEEWTYHNSEGGLATGLGSIYQKGNNVWVGWPGAYIENDSIRYIINKDLMAQKLYPVILEKKEIELYYDGFSNDTLWPLFHYFPSFAHYNKAEWQAYQSVNRKFADAVLAIAEPGDTVWVHDYQLMLVPQLIRAAMPDISIGFFQHIPFPSYEVFRLLPWRDELLQGLLGADLIGFHTYDDVRHFISGVTHIANAKAEANEIIWQNRNIIADAFPISIDFDKYSSTALKSQTGKNQQRLYQLIGERKLIISIDRLDYSKGIPERLTAFELFLKKYPEFREKVALFQLVVPSRDIVPQYAALKEQVNKMVADINARYGNLSWQPIHYFYQSFPIEMLSALYTVADVALVTPMRDGMNLVCKEYIASRLNQDGVLILSEMAGASKELYDALIINPNNSEEVADAIYEALIMPEEEQKRRMTLLQHTVRTFDINLWVTNFMQKLQSVKEKQALMDTRMITKGLKAEIAEKYKAASKRLLFLDYDGTLVPFKADPLKASPNAELMGLLAALSSDPKNKVVIISGRKKETLEAWLGDLPIDFVAEHGAWIREQGKPWVSADITDNEWKEHFLFLLQQYVQSTPGSFIEEKDYSLAWHFRKVDPGLAALRSCEIIGNLKFAVANFGLQLLEGNKVLEIKSAHINKGIAADRWLKQVQADFILAIGDDRTDEDTFKAMPEGVYNIKVGTGISVAGYFVNDTDEVRSLLETFAGKPYSIGQKGNASHSLKMKATD